MCLYVEEGTQASEVGFEAVPTNWLEDVGEAGLTTYMELSLSTKCQEMQQKASNHQTHTEKLDQVFEASMLSNAHV